MTLFTLMYMYIVILCLACYGVAYSPNLYFQNRNGRNLLARPANNYYFNGLCYDFQKCLAPGRKQFAVLTIGKLYGKNKFKPQKPNTETKCKEMMDTGQMHINYDVALPTETETLQVHTEKILLEKLTKMEAWPKGQGVVDVYLFSYWSPCVKCANAIVETSNKINNLKLHLSWQAFFQSSNENFTHQAKAFFDSLEILFKFDQNKPPNKLIVYWKNDRKNCHGLPRISYQYLFYECLAKTVEDNDIKKVIFAKWVNTLTFTCIRSMDTYSDGNACFNKEIKEKVEVNDRQHFENCILEVRNKPFNKPFVGPPLDPMNPEYGSQSLDDLRGEYNFEL